MVSGVLSNVVLSVVMFVAFAFMMLMEQKNKTGRHRMAASYIFLWLMYEIFLLFNILTDTGAVAMNRVAIFWTGIVAIWIASRDYPR